MNPRVRKQWIPNCGGQSAGICNTYSNIPPKNMQLNKLPASWRGTDKSINHAPFKIIQLRLDKQHVNGDRKSTRNGIAQHLLTESSNNNTERHSDCARRVTALASIKTPKCRHISQQALFILCLHSLSISSFSPLCFLFLDFAFYISGLSLFILSMSNYECNSLKLNQNIIM